jgi:hypothetical protein
MVLLINLRSSMFEIISNTSWVFSLIIMLGAVVMILIDYFNNKLK